MTAIIKIASPVILSLFSRREVKELVVALLERYAKTTDNNIDDTVVKMVKDSLL
jgi:hypothetical protein